ncbi:MAG: putative glycosyltransferase [Burkholderia sp.]|nr:putative glycosyltransferase [Burkholderia sp.]
MKILFLVSSLGSGGAERVATTLCNAWAARGDSVTLIPTYSGGGLPFYEMSGRVELVSLADVAGHGPKGMRSYARRLLTLRRLIVRRRPDVIVSFLPNVNVAAILSTAFTGIPLIVCERNDPSARSALDVWEIACKLIYRFADMLTVQTEAVAAKAAKIYPGVERLRVIPNPLPDGIAGPKKALPGVRRTLLSLGRLADQKQVDKLIAGFAELAARFPEWDLHIYGDGPLRPTLLAQIERSGMQDRVFLRGKTGKPWQVMANADAYAMTSKHEGFPNALLEAMGIGLACVATDCPSGPREITCDGIDALLIPPDRHRELVDALACIMGDEKLREALGQKARESVAARFSLGAVMARWDRLFDEVIASSGVLQAKRHGDPSCASTDRSQP